MRHKYCSAVLPLITALCVAASAAAYEEVLFDLSKSTGELKFEQISLNHDRDDVWMEETWRNPLASDDDKHANQRTFVTCNMDLEEPSNWLFTNAFEVRSAQRMYLELLFNTRDCVASMPCKETFLVYVKQYERASDMEELSRDTFAKYKATWTNIGRLARKNLNMTKETIGIGLDDKTKFIRFAFEEQGVCLSLLNIRVFYRVCDAFTDKLVHFNRRVTGKSESDVNYVQGTCVKNAVPSISGVELKALCMPNGVSMRTSGECQCDAGYTQMNGTCKGCPAGSFRQSEPECRRCPINTYSTHAASFCHCTTGYYRAEDDDKSGGCTQPPSRPIKLAASALSATSVRLSWEEPSYLGGRREIWYEVQCRRNADCGSAIMTPSDAKLHSRYVQINGLKPATEYTFVVMAKNKVSKFADGEASAVVEIRTRRMEEDVAAVSRLRVDAAQKDGITIAWSAVDSGLSDFEVEVRPAIRKRRQFETKHVNTTYATFIGLEEDVVYTFRVRAKDDLRWSETISYQLGRGVVNRVDLDDEESVFWNQAGSAMLIVIAGILVVIAVALCMIVMQRRSKNRKQMSDLDVLDTYKQDSMTPDYHTTTRHMNHEQIRSTTKLNAPLIQSFGSPISQPPPYYGGVQANSGKYKTYVDPTTYEDPYQALVEFTFDIDPRDVFITQVIGGGEFGDVCLGGLARSSPAATKWSTSNRVFENEQFETVAIKTLKSGSNGKAKAEFLTEASIMGQFSHPNVIRLIGVVTSSEPVMIVAEYMSNGSLDQFLRLKDQNGEKLTWEKMCEMLYGIACGMKYLTDMGYVHRDLAARNVLVDSELRCKIADFGLSRGVRSEGASNEPEYTTNGGKIPVRWTSPEAITHRKFTSSSDVWSFGVVVWEACSYGERPYWDWTNQKVISEIMVGYRLPPPMDCAMGLYRVSQWCWRMERHERPTFTQLVALLHKYLLQPNMITNDPGEMAVKRNNTYGAISLPTPPQSAPPVPSLEEFLRSIGLGHCYNQLMANNIQTMSDLMRTSPLDLLASGLISQECSAIRDGLNGRLARGSITTSSSTRRDEGFFV